MVRSNPKTWGHACADVHREIIFINLNNNRIKNEFVSSVLHEICHIIAKRQNKFRIYHNDWYRNLDQKRAFVRTALRVERYVDKQAGQLMKLFFPGMKYEYGYAKREDVEWLHKYQLSSLKEELKRRRKGYENKDGRPKSARSIALSVNNTHTANRATQENLKFINKPGLSAVINSK
ncbi:MAG: hypothetical protein QXL01_01305 [Thermoplasmatales archaeon]